MWAFQNSHKQNLHHLHPTLETASEVIHFNNDANFPQVYGNEIRLHARFLCWGDMVFPRNGINVFLWSGFLTVIINGVLAFLRTGVLVLLGSNSIGIKVNITVVFLRNGVYESYDIVGRQLAV